MTPKTNSIDPPSVFCEACLKVVPKSQALTAKTMEYIAYFCTQDCYARWRAERAPQPVLRGIQEGRDRSKSRDEQLKQLIKQHPSRDEPRADSVEPDELPGP